MMAGRTRDIHVATEDLVEEQRASEGHLGVVDGAVVGVAAVAGVVVGVVVDIVDSVGL